MSTDDYVPSEAEMREAWRAFTGPNRDHGFGTWLARVRREAKAEAWDDCAHEADRRWLIGAQSATILHDRNPYKEDPR